MVSYLLFELIISSRIFSIAYSFCTIWSDMHSLCWPSLSLSQSLLKDTTSTLQSLGIDNTDWVGSGVMVLASSVAVYLYVLNQVLSFQISA